MIKTVKAATWTFLAAPALLALGATGGAQVQTLVGVVRDSAGAPIVAAEVSVLGRRTTSDSLGRFLLSVPQADTLRVNVRRLGFENVAFTITAAEAARNAIDVVLRRLATELPGIKVEESELRARTALRGFDDRRARGVGVFVTRAEIERRNTRLLTDILRGARGMMVSRGQVRFVTYQQLNCTPMIYIDGQRAPGLALEAISATDVEGLELYQSLALTPPEFYRGNETVPCGTIVIWTKRPLLEVKP